MFEGAHGHNILTNKAIATQFCLLLIGALDLTCDNTVVKELISKLKQANPDLKEAEIVGLLYLIHSKQELTNTLLIQLTGIPKPILKTFKQSISSFLSAAGENISLNEEGLEVLSQLDLKPYSWSLLEFDLTDFEKQIEALRAKYDLQPKREYDQFFATGASTVVKAQIAINKGLVTSGDILLLGDDDLVSIAIALMSPNYNKIKIVDVDKSMLDAIEAIAKDLGLKNITTELWDARKQVPAGDLGKYDLVFIDPPYTKTGAQLFLHRSIEFLRKSTLNDSKYVLFNFGAGIKNPEIEAKIQEVISSFGLVIEDKINKLTRYNGAETVGSASSLYVLRATPFTHLTESIPNTTIYTHEDTKIEKFPYVDHVVLKANKVPAKLLKSKTQLQKVFGEFCKKHKLNVVDTIVSKFKGGGLTLTYVLSTSNLLVHTWPERNAVHIDLVTCSPIYRKEALGETISNLLDTEFVEIRIVE